MQHLLSLHLRAVAVGMPVPQPPAQIPPCGTTAPGSCLGCGVSPLLPPCSRCGGRPLFRRHDLFDERHALGPTGKRRRVARHHMFHAPEGPVPRAGRGHREVHDKGPLGRETWLERLLRLHLSSSPGCAMPHVLGDGKSLAAQAGRSPQKGHRFFTDFSKPQRRTQVQQNQRVHRVFTDAVAPAHAGTSPGSLWVLRLRAALQGIKLASRVWSAYGR